MNNKILARVVALVLAVMMLGTVSFAATLGVDSGDAADQATKTVLAFATDDALLNAPASNDDIIAVMQQDAEVTEIAIDEAKVADKKYVVVLFGGSDGKTSKAVITKVADVVLNKVIVKKEYVNDYKKYTNVAYAQMSFDATAVTTSYGIRFNSFDANGLPVGNPIDVEGKTQMSGAGTINFGALVLAVPYDTMEGASVVATPYVNY